MNLFENAELRWKHYTGKTQFNLHSPDGSLTETLARDGGVVDHQTIEPILASIARRKAKGL